LIENYPTGTWPTVSLTLTAILQSIWFLFHSTPALQENNNKPNNNVHKLHTTYQIQSSWPVVSCKSQQRASAHNSPPLNRNLLKGFTSSKNGGSQEICEFCFALKDWHTNQFKYFNRVTSSWSILSNAQTFQ